jgi:tetratricopeptide (TPR) repeat protein
MSKKKEPEKKSRLTTMRAKRGRTNENIVIDPTAACHFKNTHIKQQPYSSHSSTLFYKSEKELNFMEGSIIPKFHTSTNPYDSDTEDFNKHSIDRSEFVSIETFVIIWVDPNISLSNKDIENVIDYLQCIVNSIKTFSDIDESIDYLSEVINEKVLMIISGSIGKHVIPLIYSMNQLVSIYIFCENKSKDEFWTSKIYKVKGVFTQIEKLCDKIRIDIRDLENDLIPMSIVSPSSINDLNQLDSSFMYSQLLKEILLEDDSNDQEKEKKELIDFCRFHYAENKSELKLIDEFYHNYPLKSPIWWYTRPCFLYEMINKALRTQDVEVILKIGFIIRDVHQHIEQLHSITNHQESLIVYRGQGMLQSQFDKINKSQGGLLAFNSFLSTSTDRQVSCLYAESASQNPDLIGILFQIDIDPSRATTPFAPLDNVSFLKDQEKEVLFSMHTVFRIGSMKQLEDRLFEINLTITNDNNEQFEELTQYMRKMIQGDTRLSRMGSLMIKMGEFDKAEQIYNTLHQIISRDNDQKKLAPIFYTLGLINHQKRDLTSALSYYQKSLDIELIYLSSDDPHLSPIYSNIGLALLEDGDLKEAFKYSKCAFDIDLNTPQSNQTNIALRYNNIGGVLEQQGKYHQALENYHRALQIFLVHLPSHHPWVAAAYNNIGLLYGEIKDKSIVLSYLQKTLEIQERSLPPNHPSLATTHSNLSCLMNDSHQNPEAIKHAETALNIIRHSFDSNHPYVQMYQQGLDRLQRTMELNDVVNNVPELSLSTDSDHSSTVKLSFPFV